MIVVDSSALIAILEEESDAALYAEALAEADPPLLSTATLAEIGIVMLNRHGIKSRSKVNTLIQQAGIEIEPVTEQHARLAIEAYATYGKGQKRRAALNYGDCFSYALAKATGLPLLYKGNDFSKTDIQSAITH